MLDAETMFSPHPWGWPGKSFDGVEVEEVLPTRVGMVRSAGSNQKHEGRSPHTRGDGPVVMDTNVESKRFSPTRVGMVLGDRETGGQRGYKSNTRGGWRFHK